MPETDDPINMIPGRHLAARRGADAFIRALGGGRITLRIADPAAGDTNSQLGITPPTASDVQIAPAAVQPLPATPESARCIQVMVSARGLQPIADSYGVTDIPGWLLGSQGLLYRGRLMPIKSVLSSSFAGSDYLYLLIATE